LNIEKKLLKNLKMANIVNLMKTSPKNKKKQKNGQFDKFCHANVFSQMSIFSKKLSVKKALGQMTIRTIFRKKLSVK
jgi:hypothetical protein